MNIFILFPHISFTDEHFKRLKHIRLITISCLCFIYVRRNKTSFIFVRSSSNLTTLVVVDVISIKSMFLCDGVSSSIYNFFSIQGSPTPKLVCQRKLVSQRNLPLTSTWRKVKTWIHTLPMVIGMKVYAMTLAGKRALRANPIFRADNHTTHPNPKFTSASYQNKDGEGNRR